MSRSILAAAAFGVALAGASAPAGAATVSAGYNPALISGDTVGARYRGQSTGDEHYVGVNDLGSSANRTEQSYVWQNGAIPFSFSYDSTTGSVVSMLDDLDAISFGGPTGEAFDVLQLTLSNRSKDTATFTVSDLEVNGMPLVDGVGDPFGDLTCAAFCDFMVTDFAVATVLTVTGTINFAGTMDSNDSERVRFEVKAGTTPIPLPPALGLMLGGLSMLGFLGWRRRTA